MSTDDRPRHTRHAPLLAQLEDEARWSRGEADDIAGKPVFKSRLPLSEEPWLLLLEIEQGVSALAKQLGLPPRRVAGEQLGAILAAISALPPERAEEVERQVGEWRIRSEVVLSYRRRAHVLKAPCPLCGQHYRLMVMLDEFGPERAACKACNEEWGREALGVLAEMLDAAGIN